MPVPRGLATLVGMADANGERFCDDAVDIALLHIALEALGTGAGSLQHDIIDRMDARIAARRDIALDQHGAGLILVGFIGDISAILVADRRNEGAIQLRPESLVMVRAIIGGHEETAGDIDAIGIAISIGILIVGEAGGGIGADLFAHFVALFLVIDRA